MKNRLCHICYTDIEDELHFIPKCQMYNYLRKLYIKPIYYERPSVFKLIGLHLFANVTQNFITIATR